jgi:multicomponent Na+:H+ antiporter subunit E
VFQAISLGLVLYVVWLLLSGHFEPLLLGLGVLSCVVVVLITRRMDVVDREGHPIHLARGASTYWPWLLWEIVKSNIDVAKRVLDPSLRISPTLIRLTPTQKSDLGLVIYANSITLTPGTITVDLEPGSLLVHAIAREGAESLEAGDMDRRVTRMMAEG